MGYQNYKLNGYYNVEKYLGTDPHACVPRPWELFKICKGAFQDCEILETVVIPEGCVSIEDSAFENCVNLREVTLPLSLRNIHKRAFADCRKLQRLHFPRGVYNGQSWPYSDRLSIWGDAFTGCTALADENGFIVIDNMARQYLHPGPDVTVTEGIRDFSRDLFGGREDIHTVLLPDSLREISLRAFLGCKNLASVNIPGTVRHIFHGAFLGCDKLFPTDSDFMILDGWLCGYRGNSSHVVIPEGVKSIADHVFEKHGEIQSVSIPDSVSHIGVGCFDGCTGLVEIVLPPSLEILETAVFRDCTTLRSVALPPNLKKIQSRSFANCSALCNILLPEGLTDIGSQAFLDCSSLPPLSMPDSLQNIGGDAWKGTPVMVREDGLIIAAGKVSGYQGSGGEVVIPEGVTEICSHAFTETEITAVRFPKTLRHIDAHSFHHCRKLTEITFPEGLETIGPYAFWDCGIQEIRFPESLRDVGNDAFSANHIEEVVLPRNLGTLGNNAFDSCPVRSISLHKNLFWDHGTRPGEFSKWIDDDIDNNPFPYQEGAIMRTRLICPDFSLSQRQMNEWAEFLHLEDPIIQIWYRSWDDDEPHLNGDDYLPEDIHFNGPYLVSISPAYFAVRNDDWGDYLVVILHRQKIEKLIREDDITVTKYLSEIGPEILRDLISLAEKSGAKNTLPLLHNLLMQYNTEQKG